MKKFDYNDFDNSLTKSRDKIISSWKKGNVAKIVTIFLIFIFLPLVLIIVSNEIYKKNKSHPTTAKILTGLFIVFVFLPLTGAWFNGLVSAFNNPKSNIKPTKTTTDTIISNDIQDNNQPSITGAQEATPILTITIEPTKTKVKPTSVPTVIKPTETVTPKTQKSSVPAEYKSALAQASSYANTMYMSKRGVYDQLVSEYGGKFSAAAAQYAIDNVKANWNANALQKARSYQDTMYLSPNAIRDQLTSDYGEKFTQGEADYAIQNL
jgi:hypothetical protein